MIGHDLGGRYEILSRVGGGGMALVYKAHDILLNRKVAVKVLRGQYVNDEEFIRRFRREAQSAAALSHPNVVSIYDVGQEDETHYIVMEYVEGHNLNEIIQERAPLQADEAVKIAAQICDALDHAHQNHIIHRDIKPHNILIGNNGRVKVTDFGIARAVTSSTITQTGSVIGSVHYFSPEHAKGVNTGEKSDLYSLGIVLYQMLTGRLPFLGESPISVALKHLQETFEEPRDVNPHIPQSVENVILRAMRKNPAERYNSAREMLLDLESCLRPDRLHEPKLTFDAFHDLEETRVMPAIKGVAARDVPTSVKQSEKPEPASEPASDTSVRWNEEGLVSKPSRGWVKPVTVVGVTLSLLALIIVGFLWILNKLDTEEVDVPYVVGHPLNEARSTLTEAGIRVEDPVEREFSKDVPKDTVMEQSKRNQKVKKGSSIRLIVSDGPEMKEMSRFTGMQLAKALEELYALGVPEEGISVKEINSEDEPGVILEQTPRQGELLEPETAQISFVVSLGREMVEMPNLVDEKLSTVRNILKSLELVLEDDDIHYEPSYLHQKDYVISQDNYDPGDQVPKGSKVSIKVSTGIPNDAKSYKFNVKISPASVGKASDVRIVYSDATGERIEGTSVTINSTVDIPVTLILAPETVATVMVYRDDQLMDAKTISYEKLMAGTESPSLTIPGEEPTPSEPPEEENVPAQAEVNDVESEDEETEAEQPEPNGDSQQ